MPVDTLGEGVDEDFSPGSALHGSLWYCRALAVSPRFRGTSDDVSVLGPTSTRFPYEHPKRSAGIQACAWVREG